MARKVPPAKPPNRPPTCPNISPTTHPASLARGAPARAGGGRAKIKSKKVQELELRDEENAKIAHEVAQQRAETRYQNEVHDPSREEIRAHNAQALQKEPGPGFYEVPVPSFQRVVNTRALQNEMIASQMRAAHIQAVEPSLLPALPRRPCPSPIHNPCLPSYRNTSPSRDFEYNNGDDNNSEDESDARTEGEDDDNEPGEFPKFDRRRLRARERRLKDQKSRHGLRTQRERKHDNNLNRGSLADIDEEHRPLVSNAIEKYISITLDEDPLGLEPAKARARVAMRQASEEDGKLLLKPNQFIVRLMTSRNTNARKPFVKEMRKRVVPYYGFSARTDEATMQMNRLNCEALLNDGRFLVANHTLQELVGPYMCPLFFNVIKACCFTSKNAIGTRAAGGWSSISLSFLAFVATVAQHCVSEWVSGECVESPFSAEKYEGKFLAHHKTLKQQRAEASASMDLYCKSLVERASRDHAKSTGSGGNASASVPDHIVRDWAVRYDVTSRNLARDSTFTGGLAFRVEQPQSSNITGVHIERLITSTNSPMLSGPSDLESNATTNLLHTSSITNHTQTSPSPEPLQETTQMPQPIRQLTPHVPCTSLNPTQLANRPSTLENYNKNQQTAPEVPQPPFGNSFRGWQNININQVETDSERISQASRVPRPIGQATIRILSSKATHPEPSYAHGLAPFARSSPVSGVFAPAPHSAAPAVAYSNLQMDSEDSRLAPAQLSQSGRQVPSHPNTENTLVLPSSNNAVGGWN